MTRRSPSMEAAGTTGPNLLTRGNLEQFTAAERRDRAHRKGQSTPSPEPDLHEYESEVSYRIPAEVMARYKQQPRQLHPSLMVPLPFNVGPSSLQRPPNKSVEMELPRSDRNSAGHAVGLDPGAGKSHAPDDPRTGDSSANNHANDAAEGRSRAHSGSPPAGHEPNAPIADDFFSQFRRNLPPRLPDSRPAIPRQQPKEWPSKPEPRLPSNFPAYYSTQNMNEIAAYLANASYVAALGGPPLSDLKYGIIIVPAGEESLLFGRSPDFVISEEFRDAIDDANRDYQRALRMHDPDKDSPEFVRHRFKDDFPSVSAEDFQRVELTPPQQDKGEEEKVAADEAANPGEVEVPLKKAKQGRPRGRPRTSLQPQTSRTETSKPQGIVKTRRSPRVAAAEADGPRRGTRRGRGKK
ncbi:hypothetical protein VTK56DRAFT_2350 [Thermocarpiscus australiensis]